MTKTTKTNSTMKTIGVLGGIGPQATIDFEERVHRAAQATIPPWYNEGYPPMVSVYVRHAPVLVEGGKPTKPLKLDPRFLDAARRLGEWADLLAIPSNTPHCFLDEIGAAAGCPVVSIVDVTVAELRRRGCGTVGLLGLGIPAVYARRFESEGLVFHVAPEETRGRLDDAILRLMEGRAGEEERRAALDAVEALRSQEVDAVVLGCSEIPLLLGSAAEADGLVNPAELLAVETVRRAIED